MRVLVLVTLCLFAAGCAHGVQYRADIEKKLMDQRAGLADRAQALEQYVIGCPDVVEITAADQPDGGALRTVGADGRIDLGAFGQLRIEGLTPAQAAALAASAMGVPAGAVQVRVAEYKSQQLFLFGQVVGWQRSVPYQGQETVLNLLQRVGGITPGAEPRDVYVVRPHIVERGRPEVFHVDLEAIALRHDDKTNLRLMPGDQIHVGETRGVRMERAIPPVLRKLFGGEW